MNAVREAITNAGMFFVAEDFDLWKQVGGSGVSTFVKQYSVLYSAFLAQRRKSFDTHYSTCNKVNRLSCVDAVGGTSAPSRSGVPSRKRGATVTKPPKSGVVKKGSSAGTRSGKSSSTAASRRRRSRGIMTLMSFSVSVSAACF